MWQVLVELCDKSAKLVLEPIDLLLMCGAFCRESSLAGHTDKDRRNIVSLL
jgi:hypothetical protein